MNGQMKQDDSRQDKAVSEHIYTLVTFLALVPLVYFIPDFVEPFLPPIKWLNVMVVVGIIVPIISYGIMPVVRYVLSRWLAMSGGCRSALDFRC